MKIKVRPSGRLGNQMFQLAMAFYVVQLARRADPRSKVHWYASDGIIRQLCSSLLGGTEWLCVRSALLPALLLGTDAAPIQSKAWTRRAAWKAWTLWDSHGSFPLDRPELVSDLAPYLLEFSSKPSSVLIQGQFQSFETAQALLPTLLDPADSLSRGLRERILSEDPIAVHVRCTDFLRADVAKAHGMLTDNFYGAALEYLDPSASRPVWIFSDDYPVARVKLSRVLRNFKVFEAPKCSNDVRVLCALATCRTKVLSNSTFSWWGGYLSTGDSTVLAPEPLTLDTHGATAAAPAWLRIPVNFSSG